MIGSRHAKQASGCWFNLFRHRFEKLRYYADLNTNSLRARSVVDGSLVWESVNVAHDNFNRPFVAGDFVYATGLDGKVYAFNATGGEILWKLASLMVFPGVPLFRHPSYEPRAVVFAAGQDSIGDVFMVGLDAQTGAHVWTSGALNTGSGATVTDPIAYSWGMVVGTRDGRLIFVDPDTGGLNEIQLSPSGILASPKFAWF